MNQQPQESKYLINLAPFLPDIAEKLLSCDQIDYKDIPLHIVTPIIFQAIAELIEDFSNNPYPHMKDHHHQQIKQDAHDHLKFYLVSDDRYIDEEEGLCYLPTTDLGDTDEETEIVETPEPIEEPIESKTDTEQVLEQISNIIDSQVTVYTTDGFGMSQKLEGKILRAEIAPYAQYDDGIKLTFKRKKKRKSQIIRAYRGWSSEGRDGIVRNHGRELVVVPGWGDELRLPDEILDQNAVTGVVVSKAVGLDFRTFPIIKEKASAIEGSITFAITP